MISHFILMGVWNTCLCACPHPSLEGMRTSFSRAALAMLHQRWTGMKSSPSLSTPLPSVCLLLHSFLKIFLPQVFHSPLFHLAVHLNQVCTKPIPCDRQLLDTSGYNSQQVWLQEIKIAHRRNGTAFPSDPLSSPLLSSLTVRFFSVLTALHSLLHPEISTQPHRPAGRRQHGLLAAQPSHLALSFARQVPNSVPHVLFLSLDSHTLSFFCNFLTTPKVTWLLSFWMI